MHTILRSGILRSNINTIMGIFIMMGPSVTIAVLPGVLCNSKSDWEYFHSVDISRSIVVFVPVGVN